MRSERDGIAHNINQTITTFLKRYTLRERWNSPYNYHTITNLPLKICTEGEME